MKSTGVRSGILLALVGLWLIMRTTHQDVSSRTLVDHILGKASSLKTSATSTPAAAAATPPTATAITPTATAITPTVSNVTPTAGARSAPPTGPTRGTNIPPVAAQQLGASLDALHALGF